MANKVDFYRKTGNWMVSLNFTGLPDFPVTLALLKNKKFESGIVYSSI